MGIRGLLGWLISFIWEAMRGRCLWPLLQGSSRLYFTLPSIPSGIRLESDGLPESDRIPVEAQHSSRTPSEYSECCKYSDSSPATNTVWAQVYVWYENDGCFFFRCDAWREHLVESLSKVLGKKGVTTVLHDNVATIKFHFHHHSPYESHREIFF